MANDLTIPEKEALLTIALMAAFADGGKSDLERAEVKRIAENLTHDAINLSGLYQRVLLRQSSVPDVAAPLATPELRQLAYEMALCVCESDDRLNPAEATYLSELSDALGLDRGLAATIQERVDAVAQAPLTDSAAPTVPVPPILEASGGGDAEADRMILHAAILNGALELLPDSLATAAIVPLQMRLVYRIGKRHGYELDRRHITELVGAAGIGLTSQMFEGVARKLLGGLLGKVGGALGRGAGGHLASSAMSFASTYALGQLAQRYYAGGRQLSASQLKTLFSELTGRASSLHQRYVQDIQQKASQLKPAQLLQLMRGQDNP